MKTAIPKVAQELAAVCREWSSAMSEMEDQRARMAFIRDRLPGLLMKKALFAEILKNIVRGESYPDTRQSTLFENEIYLHTDARRRFSVHLYLHGPGEFTPVHDHNAWGVYGVVWGNLEVVKYIREDDGSREGHARLKVSERLPLMPGETDTTLPLNKGIHATGNPGTGTTVVLSFYGTPIRRLFVLGFDPERNESRKLVPARLRKKMLAAGALEAF
jgi:predicted metal-dependent enzyme (double-stranded beta helix superfamily)